LRFWVYNFFMWYLYILRTKDGRLYTGITKDLVRRMKQHQTGKGARFTKIFGFEELLFSQRLLSQSEALKREADVKTWPKTKKLKLIAGNIRLRSKKSAESV